MFFPRLRNQAKWAFVFLILVFAGGFVFLGVGSGGLDLGQLLRDAFGNKGTSTGSVSKAQEQVREHPRDPVAYRKLADVLEKKGRTDEAIAAWSQYTALRPRDVDRLRHLGDLQLGQADRYFREAQLAALAQQEASAASRFGPSATGKFGQALGQDPIAAALVSKANTQLQEASTKYQTAANSAVGTYEKIVELRPNDQQALFSLAQAADTLQQTAVAVKAYKRLLAFDLDAATKAQIRERIRTLNQQLQPPPGGG
jgi:tetratricopeptide (TPR) repeat protein